MPTALQNVLNYLPFRFIADLPLRIYIGSISLSSALMFIGGVMMLMLGLIGEYIGRMYICMNNAPQFVVRDLITISGDGEDDSNN